MTQYELDNIDLRADMEIYQLLSCAVIKCRVERRAPSFSLLMKRRKARQAFEKALPPDKVYRMYCEVEADGNGRPKVGGHIECVIQILERDAVGRAGRMPEMDDDEDDDEEDY